MRASLISALVVVLLAGAILAGSYVLLETPGASTSTSEAGCPASPLSTGSS